MRLLVRNPQKWRQQRMLAELKNGKQRGHDICHDNNAMKSLTVIIHHHGNKASYTKKSIQF
jgi:hypothetical protein